MIIEIYAIILLTAIFSTAITVFAGLSGGVGGVEVTSRTGMIISAACFGLWALLAINAFEITVHSGGEEFVRSYPQLAWIAVAGAMVALYSLFQAAITEFEQTGGL